MPRVADDILIGGGRVFIKSRTVTEGTGSTPATITEGQAQELGWLSGEIRAEEQANSQTIKESEGGTVLTIATDKEVHLTFSLLEANIETFKLLNPSYKAIEGGFAAGTYQSDTTYIIEFWHKKRNGDYRCFKIYKGKISGNFTPLIINQDNENPIAIDVVGLADETKNTDENLYQMVDIARSDVATVVPGGGW